MTSINPLQVLSVEITEDQTVLSPTLYKVQVTQINGDIFTPSECGDELYNGAEGLFVSGFDEWTMPILILVEDPEEAKEFVRDKLKHLNRVEYLKEDGIVERVSYETARITMKSWIDLALDESSLRANAECPEWFQTLKSAFSDI